MVKAMNTYVILIRGINVGGKNLVPMAALKLYLEEEGFTDVTTYIQSGNVILRSDLGVARSGQRIEAMLLRKFTLDSPVIKVLVLTRTQLQAVIDNRPEGFGEHPETYHSDAVFLMGIDSTQAMAAFNPREGVDNIWPGAGVIYSQRLSALRTRSRLSSITGTPAYKSMTIRNWNTTTRLLKMVEEVEDRRRV
ncbi:DUF1697 domain-containing protein [Pseudofrankia sp. BMG5.37]|uniref:DUF1697 domain-containing protein n=1 Tax=Pseudofrankia sp. BMG5.37 TaxID=3050035 RepID=UPI002894FBF8|nr:DUF1697 domain-containing protein [Pseudofrankia sp. BMG5.37]MDT3440845.1 DUF1697 domain-containing protein [Pseudofrankia sp. BMG5.37]